MNKNIFTVIFFISKLIMIILIFTKVSYSNEEKWDLNKFNENIKWNCISGNCIDGFGVATYSDPQGRSIKYSGSWKDAKRHGKGVQERNHYVGNGVVGFNQKAEGVWENDIANGSSKIIFSNGLTNYQELIKGKIIGERVITPDFEYIGEPIDLKFNDRIGTVYAYLLKNCEAQGFKGNRSNPITYREEVDIVWYFFSRNNSKHEIVYYFGRINSEKENFFYGEGKFLKDKGSDKGVVQNSDKDITIRLYDKKAVLRDIKDDTFIDYFCK